MATDRGRRAAQRRIASQLRSGRYERQFTRETRRAREVRQEYVQRERAEQAPPVRGSIARIRLRKAAFWHDTIKYDRRASDRNVSKYIHLATPEAINNALTLNENQLDDLVAEYNRRFPGQEHEYSFLWYH